MLWGGQQQVANLCGSSQPGGWCGLHQLQIYEPLSLFLFANQIQFFKLGFSIPSSFQFLSIKYSGHSDPSPSCRSVWTLSGGLCHREKQGAQPQTGCAVLGAVLCLGGSFLARVAGSFTLPAFITDP